MIPLEEIEKYLPKYLSSSAQEDLFEELKSFPNNMDHRLYTIALMDQPQVYQGDGFRDMLFVNLPGRQFGNAPGMIISNTCDMDPANRRFMPMRMVYAPIFGLQKYRNALNENLVTTGIRSPESIDSHITEIQNQRISHIFYLPRGGGLENESIVLFDRLNNVPSDQFELESIPNKRLFTLSDYGYYLFLFKLSVHFTRVREGISRSLIPGDQGVRESSGYYRTYSI